MERDEKRRRSLYTLPEETEVLFSYLKEAHTADTHTHTHTHSYKHTTAVCVLTKACRATLAGVTSIKL